MRSVSLFLPWAQLFEHLVPVGGAVGGWEVMRCSLAGESVSPAGGFESSEPHPISSLLSLSLFMSAVEDVTAQFLALPPCMPCVWASSCRGSISLEPKAQNEPFLL